MKEDFDKILDECIDRINKGEELNSCLTDYPGYAGQLRPLLQAVLAAREAYSFTLSPVIKRASREQFNEALEVLRQRQAKRQTWFTALLGQSRVWATAAAVILIAVISFFVIKPLLFLEETEAPPGPSTITTETQPGPGLVTPNTQPSTGTVLPGTQTESHPVATVAQPSPEGNFVFLISDDVNAINDFDSVNVTILKIGLQSGDSGQLIEFEPELSDVDLTLVQGDKTQEIWRGNILEGEYTSTSIEVSDVRGILKGTGEEVEIKLPSQKLHISKRFQVSADILTTFTYDLTVVAAGSPQSGIKYILKPQVDQSGASNKPIEPKGKANKEKPDGK